MPATIEFKKWYDKKVANDPTVPNEIKKAFLSAPKEEKEKHYQEQWEINKKSYSKELSTGKAQVAKTPELTWGQKVSLGKGGDVLESIQEGVENFITGQATIQKKEGFGGQLKRVLPQIATGGIYPSPPLPDERQAKEASKWPVATIKKLPSGAFQMTDSKGNVLGVSKRPGQTVGQVHYKKTPQGFQTVPVSMTKKYLDVSSATRTGEGLLSVVPSLAVNPLITGGKTIPGRIVAGGALGAFQGGAGGGIRAAQEGEDVAEGAKEGALFGAGAGLLFGTGAALLGGLKALRAGKLQQKEAQALASRLDELVTKADDITVPLDVREEAARKLDGVLGELGQAEQQGIKLIDFNKLQDAKDSIAKARAAEKTLRHGKQLDAETELFQRENARLLERQAKIEASESARAATEKRLAEQELYKQTKAWQEANARALHEQAQREVAQEVGSGNAEEIARVRAIKEARDAAEAQANEQAAELARVRAVIEEKTKAIDDIDREIIRLEGSPYVNDDNYWKAVDLKTKRSVLQKEIEALTPSPEMPSTPPAQAPPRGGVGGRRESTPQGRIVGGKEPAPQGRIIGTGKESLQVGPAQGRIVAGSGPSGVANPATTQVQPTSQRGKVNDLPVPGQPSAIRQTYETAQESKIILPEVRDRVAQLMEEESDEVMRRVISNEESVAAAEASLKGLNLDDPDQLSTAFLNVGRELDKGKKAADPTVAALLVMRGIGNQAKALKGQIGQQVNDAARAAIQGKYDGLVRMQGELLDKYSRSASQKGRDLQILKLLKSMEPEGILMKARDDVAQGLGKGMYVKEGKGRIVGKGRQALAIPATAALGIGGPAQADALMEEADRLEAAGDIEGAREKRILAGGVLLAALSLGLAVGVSSTPRGRVGGGGPGTEGLLNEALESMSTKTPGKQKARFGYALKTQISDEGAARILDLANKLQGGDIQALGAIHRIVNEEIPAGFWRKLSTSRYMAMLSSPATMLKQPISTGTIYGVDTAEGVVRGALDTGLGRITGQRTEVMPSLGQIGREAKSGVRGLVGGVRRAARGEQNPHFLGDVGMTETGGYGAYGYQGGGSSAFSGIPVMEQIEKAIRAGYTVPDDATKSMAMWRSLENDIRVQAMNRGKDWNPDKDFLNRVWEGENLSVPKLAKELESPGLELTNEMLQESKNMAQKWTFQDENEIGKLADKFHEAFGKIGFGTQGARMRPNAKRPEDWKFKDSLGAAKDFNLAQIVLPFKGVPAALAQRAIRRLGMPFYLGATIAGEMADNPGAFKRGANGLIQMTPQTQREIVRLVAELPTTVGAVGGAAYLTSLGLMHGGTSDYKQTQVEQERGLIPNSLNLSGLMRVARAAGGDEDVRAAAQKQDGDQYISLEGIDPLFTPVAAAASGMRAAEEKDSSVFKEIPLAAMQSIEDRSMLQGIKKLFKHDNSLEFLLDALTDIPATFAPTLGSRVASGMDENIQRQTRGGVGVGQAFDKVKAKTPGLRESLPKSIGVFGDVKQFNQPGGMFQGALLNMVNPFKLARYDSDEAFDTAEKLRKATGKESLPPDIQYDANKGFIQFGAEKYPVTPEQAEELQRMGGKAAREAYAELKNDIAKAKPDEIEYLKDELDNLTAQYIKEKREDFIDKYKLKPMEASK